MRAYLLRSALAACLLGGLIYVLSAGGASGQQYQLPPPPPAAVEPLPLLKPFPKVRIRGFATRRGARIESLTVRARVGVIVLSRCLGRARRCPYKERVQQIKGAEGTTRRIHIRRFERSFRAGVKLRLYMMFPGRTGKFTSFAIRRRKVPRRTDRCLRGLEPKAIRCPD